VQIQSVRGMDRSRTFVCFMFSVIGRTGQEGTFVGGNSATLIFTGRSYIGSDDNGTI
jgi:hypothetical protein